jgi:hypothetical protein
MSRLAHAVWSLVAPTCGRIHPVRSDLEVPGCSLLDVAAPAYFADASSVWVTEGFSTIGGNFDFPTKRCCTRSR